MGTFSKNKRKQRYEFSHQKVNMGESMNSPITPTDVLNYGILIVDDETNILKLLSTILVDEGFKHIITASDEIKCMDMLREYCNDIVIITMDVKLNNNSGIEVIKDIVRCHNKLVGIIIYSAFSTCLEDIKNMKSMGNENVIILDYLVKCGNTLELIDTIKENIPKVLEKRRGLMDAVIL